MIQSLDSDFRGCVTDIGANLGYFGFRLMQDYSAKVSAYEPFAAHAEAMRLLRDHAGRSDEEFRVVQKGVGIRDIDKLEETDLLILLNVLHHAGDDFDGDFVKSIDQWNNYAVEYLAKLKKKSRTMFFQLGYTWKGSAGKICADGDIIDFTGKLLRDAGWNIRRMGLVLEYKNPIGYTDQNYDPVNHNDVSLPEVSPSLGARILNKISRRRHDLQMTYRFAQRPLWFCD